MRISLALGICLLASACSDVEPGVPMMMGANEMQQRPGAFSGADGQFVLAGSETWPTDDPVTEASLVQN